MPEKIKKTTKKKNDAAEENKPKKPRVKKVAETEKEEPKEEVLKPEITMPAEEGGEIYDDKKNKAAFLQAVGRRKESIARVKLFKNGSGKVTINGRDIKDYLKSDLLADVALGALTSVNQLRKLDVSAKVSGGGLHGQAEAIRLGTARGLLQLNPVFKKNLRKAGFLTRDPRIKERKKPGLKKARRAPQWSKR